MSVNDLSGYDLATRWLVAAEIGRRLDSSYKLSEWGPKGGFYDCLVLHTSPLSDSPSVALNRHGQLVVLKGGRATTVAEDPWPALAEGSASVVALADETSGVLASVGVSVEGGGASRCAQHRMLAELARVFALFDLDWSLRHGRFWQQAGEFAVAPTSDTPEVMQISSFFAAFPDLQREVGDSLDRAAEVWFILDELGNPVAASQGDDRLHVLTLSGVQTKSLDPDELLARPWKVVGDQFGALVASAAREREPRRPGLGVPAVLEAFNRKERSVLFAAITGSTADREAHGPSLQLAPWWAEQLSRVPGLGWTVPSWAWMGVDYHLSWLHGALSWAAGRAWPAQTAGFPSISSDLGSLITGNQEDADLLLCWAEGGRTRLLVVEAKGYGAWGNAQMTSKLARLDAIREGACLNGLALDIRVVLCSPAEPQKLATSTWPKFALDDSGTPFWVQLPTSGLRLTTQRVDDEGSSSAMGQRWRLTGPNRG